MIEKQNLFWTNGLCVLYVAAFFYVQAIRNADHYLDVDNDTVEQVESKLFSIVLNGDVRRFRLIVKARPDVLSQKSKLLPKLNNVDTILLSACRRNNPECIPLLLKHGANIEATNKSGETALCISSRANNHKIVKVLLEHGANIEFKPTFPSSRHKSKYDWRRTPLYAAVDNQSYEAAKVLLEHGAKVVSNPTLDYKFAIHYACEKFEISRKDNDSRIVNLLILHGADVNQPDTYGKLPIHSAAGQWDLMKYLLIETDIDVNATTLHGHATALHMVISGFKRLKGHKYHTRKQGLELISIFIERGARTDIKTYKVGKYESKSSLDQAIEYGDQEILALLAKAKNPPLLNTEND